MLRLGKAAGFVHQGLDDLRRTPAAFALDDLQNALLAELFAGAVARLGNPVGNQQQQIALLQRELGGLQRRLFAVDAQRGRPRHHLRLDRSVRRQHVPRRMPRIDVGPQPGRRIELGEKQRDEMVEAEVFDHQGAHPRQDVLEALVRHGQRPQVGAGVGHQQGGPHPVTGHVAHHDEQLARPRGNEIEVVAARGGRRQRRAGDVELRQGGRARRKQPLLDFAREAEFLLLRQQGALGGAPGAALLGIVQLAGRRRHQPRQVALHQVILRPRLHRRHRRLLADRPRHDDERHVHRRRANDLQRFRRTELRHVVVGIDDVPRAGLQGLGQVFRVVHAPGLRFVAARPQLLGQQQRVGLRVLDDQGFQRFFRGGISTHVAGVSLCNRRGAGADGPGTGAGSLTRPQNRPRSRTVCRNSSNSTGLTT